jgi:adenylosuccinate synthase
MYMQTPSVTCIIDGQYGSCGKGMICGYLAGDFDVAVRVGAPNAGHTLIVGKKIWKMRQIPVAGLINPDIVLCIGAAGLINLDVLYNEMQLIPNCRERLYIDRNAGILEPRHIKQEEDEQMNKRVGSTCEGVGAALRDKIKRDGNFRTAKDVPQLRHDTHITNVSTYLNTLSSDSKIMIEGTQGYGLSLNHGPYPYCTGRDVLASSLLSDVGLAPSLCNEVIMVIRTYPIRVAGNSGPMCGEELTWDEVTKRSGSPTPLTEQTTVTKRTRRVCEFDLKLVKEATLVNRPTQIALTFIDYINHEDYGKKDYDKLSLKSRTFIEDLQDALGIPITIIKTGPDILHTIDRRGEYRIIKHERTHS